MNSKMKTITRLVDGRVSKKRIINLNSWKRRKAVRAVIWNDLNKMPLLWSNKYKFHKIPGGGIEKGEVMKKALKREIMEEVGVKIKTIIFLGIIEEYWTENKYFQKSWCFTAKINKIVKAPKYTEEEKLVDMQLKWYDKSEVLKVMYNDEAIGIEHKVINLRDYLILENILKK